jgi:hypothetical protein
MEGVKLSPTANVFADGVHTGTSSIVHSTDTFSESRNDWPAVSTDATIHVDPIPVDRTTLPLSMRMTSEFLDTTASEAGAATVSPLALTTLIGGSVICPPRPMSNELIPKLRCKTLGAE